eukprot:TRINITY_DN4491_c2_g2_i1.p1 TRINITY_DN4491_c2_g2~~TRINITY_DN4491_c2_g2_i1.p1  ORF type:complete len:395 (+),score=78.13 TRINITY_DN4491_c2_g2_i1:53-1186(+)
MLQIFAAMAAASTVVSTVYRVTPKNYSDTILNMNTGDVNGDCTFGLMELTFPFWCKDNPNELNCKNVPILNIPGFNDYEEYKVEHDARLGAYALCNPNPDTGIFACESSSVVFHSHKCWYDDPVWVNNFSGLCSMQECLCPAVMNQSVGAEYCPLCSWGAPQQPGLPSVCTNKYPSFANMTLQFPEGAMFHGVTDAASCCAKCDSLPGCSGITYNDSSSMCTVGTNFQLVPSEGQWSVAKQDHGLNGTGSLWIGRVNRVSAQLNGTWYSTQEQGECKGDQKIGEDCWWRKLSMPRKVNSTCVSNNVIKSVRQQRPSCWDECEASYPLAGNCSVTCLFNAIEGIGYPSPMLKDDICSGFRSSFGSSDPSKLGCPELEF